MQLSLDEFYTAFDLVERGDAAFQDLDVRLLDAFGLFVTARILGSPVGLRQLVMNRLAVNGFQMLFSAAVNVEQIDKIFPALFESMQIGTAAP